MRPISNLTLLSGSLLIATLIGLTVASQLLNGEQDQTKLNIFIVTAIILGVSVSIYARRVLFRKHSIWLEPVSDRTSKIIVNSVVSIWLCFVGLIFFMVLKVTKSLNITLAAIAIIAAAAAYGRYLKKRYWSTSFLGYGISFFAALIVILFVFIVNGIDIKS